MKLSVIICTHNPREEYLQRTLKALREQDLTKDQWELLLIDNASEMPLFNDWDLSWHPNGHHVREDELGLTPARIRGIKQSKAKLLVFVDDDNVLNPNYLKESLVIADAHPFVGSYGGSSIGSYESEPSERVACMLYSLAIRKVDDVSWACSPGTKALFCAPCGAGMVIRKTIAEYYIENIQNDPIRRGLGRKGNSLTSAEDSDMALCACDLGFAVGLFPQLSLKHLIPSQRLDEEYLLRLAEGTEYSHAILNYIRSQCIPKCTKGTLSRSERLFRAYQSMRRKIGKVQEASFQDLVDQARLEGRERARRDLLEICPDLLAD